MSFALRLALALCGSTVACGDGDEPPFPPLELGTGKTVFQSFEDGGHIRLEAAPTGSYHVWLSMRAELESGPMQVSVDVLPTHPARPDHMELTLDFRAVTDEPGLAEYVGYPARILSPECSVGAPVDVYVRLVDVQGRTARDTLTFIPDPPQPDFSSTCIE